MHKKTPFFQSSAKKFIGFFTLGLCILTIGSAHAASGPQSVVVLFGDSITSGVNLNLPGARFGNGSTTQGCPTIYLNNILGKEGTRSNQQTCPTEDFESTIFEKNSKTRSAIVANWGIGGSNTSDGVGRISPNLSQTKNTFDAENYFVLILYGTNDPAFGISSTTTRFNTRLMIAAAREQGYEPIIGTITPRDDLNIMPYNAQIVSAANQEGVFVVDHFSRFINEPNGWRSLLDQEINPNTGQLARLHPNDKGYLIIAETWFDKRLRNVIPGIADFTIAPIMTILLDD